MQLAQLGQVRERHTRELALPFVVGRLADAVLSARLVDTGAEFNLLEDAGYLGFTESGFLHVETPLGWILYFRVVQVFEGTLNIQTSQKSPHSPRSEEIYSHLLKYHNFKYSITRSTTR